MKHKDLFSSVVSVIMSTHNLGLGLGYTYGSVMDRNVINVICVIVKSCVHLFACMC